MEPSELTEKEQLFLNEIADAAHIFWVDKLTDEQRKLAVELVWKCRIKVSAGEGGFLLQIRRGQVRCQTCHGTGWVED